MIRLGSQVDVVLPARPDVLVNVQPGQRVRAGESVLAVVGTPPRGYAVARYRCRDRRRCWVAGVLGLAAAAAGSPVAGPKARFKASPKSPVVGQR